MSGGTTTAAAALHFAHTHRNNKNKYKVHARHIQCDAPPAARRVVEGAHGHCLRAFFRLLLFCHCAERRTGEAGKAKSQRYIKLYPFIMQEMGMSCVKLKLHTEVWCVYVCVRISVVCLYVFANGAYG